MPFRKVLSATLLAATAVLPASAQDMRLGFAAPMSDPFAIVGKQASAGAEAAAVKTGAVLTIVDEVCTSDGGALAAKQLIAANVQAVAGFLCLESLQGALPSLTAAGIPVVTTGVRADTLTENKDKTGFLLFRIAPADRMESEALAADLLVRWRDSPFAIIDDGTVHARDLAEALRTAATDKNLKPVYFDTFRPGLDNQSALARRLAKAGATKVFMGGDVEDALVLAKNTKDLGIQLDIAIGEPAVPSSAPAAEILAAQLPDLPLLPTAKDAVIAIRAKNTVPDNNALSAYASIEVMVNAFANNPANIVQALTDDAFQTSIGTITFDKTGERIGNPFRVAPLEVPAFLPENQ